MDHYVMDAGGLIAYLRYELGHDLVKTRLENSYLQKEMLWMHTVNLCEVYYDAYRQAGKDIADQLLEDVGKLPIHFVQTINIPLLKEAGRLKAAGRISLADS